MAPGDADAGRPGLLRVTPSPVLVLVGIGSVQFGSALAHTIFHRVGPGGAGFLRLLSAALVLLLIHRPRLRGRDPRGEWLPAVALGLTLAGMNVIFYHAIGRIPLGIAVTIEFIGPLGVAVAGSRRPRDLVWAGLAAAGILALAHGSTHGLDGLGVLFAALAGALWAAYILLQANLGRAFTDGSGLALAMIVATVAQVPDGVAEGGGAMFHPGTLAIGLAVGLLASVIPYSLELEALRRMRASLFGVLMSLEPAAAALAGLLVLSQSLSARELVGIVLVIAASLGASLGARTPPIDA